MHWLASLLPPRRSATLKVVQNFVNHYSRTQLKNQDRVNELRSWISARAYTGSEEVSQPFTFEWELDQNGGIVLGNGSDDHPFIAGLTTKALMLRMLAPLESFILHIDATYKINYVDYPVVVVGVSDRSRGFHVMALFVVSQETQPVFEAVLPSLRRLFYWITQRELCVRFAMANGDQAQYNALHSVFGGYPPFQSLMCFFHVMENVQKVIRTFPSGVAALNVRDVYDLHFRRSANEFVGLREQILAAWMSNPFLYDFAQYMSGQWLFGIFCSWQAYLTPSGFATTNNPTETFNALLKRDYTLRRRRKMGTLLRELSACCQDQSSSTRPFLYRVVPSPTLMRRVSELARENLLGVWCGGLADPKCAGSPSIVRIVSYLAKRIAVAPDKRGEVGIAVSAQMGANYARMEVQGQPWGGWQVDVGYKWCGCNYFYVFGVRIHILYALRVTEHVDGSGRSILVNLKKRKRGCVGGGSSGGRSPAVGPALSL